MNQNVPHYVLSWKGEHQEPKVFKCATKLLAEDVATTHDNALVVVRVEDLDSLTPQTCGVILHGLNGASPSSPDKAHQELFAVIVGATTSDVVLVEPTAPKKKTTPLYPREAKIIPIPQEGGTPSPYRYGMTVGELLDEGGKGADIKKDQLAGRVHVVRGALGGDAKFERQNVKVGVADQTNEEAENMVIKKAKAPAKSKKAKAPAKAKVAGAGKDQFGLRKGSKASEAATMFARASGATIAQVKEKIGFPPYNILKKIIELGNTIKKDDGVYYLKTK